MLHKSRVWGVALCEDQEELAQKLVDGNWVLCTAFRSAKGTIWANDATSEDSLQEYGVLRQNEQGQWRQVESITVDWCDLEKMKQYVEQADAGVFDEDGYCEVGAERFQEDHPSCQLCG